MYRSIFLLFYLLAFLPHAIGNQGSQAIDSLRKQVNTEPEQVLLKIDSMISLVLNTGDSLKYARLMDIKGLAQRNTGDYAGAITSHHQAYAVYNSKGVKSSAGGSLNNLGIVMIKTSQYDKAASYLNNALKYINSDDTVMHKIIYINLGVAYDYSGYTERAIDAYKQALKYTEALGDDHSMGIIHHNIGVCYEVLKDYNKAEQYELRALQYQEKTGDHDLLARISISLGSLYLNEGKVDKAQQYYETGGKAAAEINAYDLQEKYYQHLVELYIVKKDSEKALLYIDSLNTLKEKLFSEENLRNIAEAETKFNVDLKNREIENLRISKNLADVQIQRDKQARYALLLVIFFILVLLVILFWNYKLRRKNLDLLAREKLLIENEKAALEKNNEYLQSENILARFEILKSQVSPHFLFNTLNALSYLIESDPEKAVHFTNAFSKLYRTILELKDQNLITLEKELSHVEAYFFLQLTRFDNNLVINKNIDDRYLHLKLPPFSIQLAVENAINHNVVSEAHPLKIEIYCKNEFLIIENNLQPKTNKVRSTEVGITNIKSRYSYFTETAPEFTKTSDSFIVKLPLLDK